MKRLAAAEVPEGTKFRWRPHSQAGWQEYTVIGWDEIREAPIAKCSHGFANQFNPCAIVEIDYD